MQGRLRRALLRHYSATKRDLPWRGSTDPYRIWVSEVMLQQTRAATVGPHYTRFLERFPTVEALAAATPEAVCEQWSGLGYYGRARRLHEAAQAVVDRFGGALPQSAAELKTLPGIGDYTAGAIASIAFGEAAAVVDANVARVLSRLYALDVRPDQARGRRELWRLANELVTGEAPGDLNQALMDLGATICSVRAPRCNDCPVRKWCTAHRSGDEERYPPALSKPMRSELGMTMAWIRDARGVWLERRPLHGLWAGQWQLPSEEGPGSVERLQARLACRLAEPLCEIRHELTHRTVLATVYTISAPHPLRRRGGLAPFADPLAAPLSSLARRAIGAAGPLVGVTRAMPPSSRASRP